MNRSTKEELVGSMREKLLAASSVIITRQEGLTVAEVTELRRQMRAAGVEFKVMKNTLATLAVKGTQMEGLESFMVGPTALAYSQDPVAAAKAVDTFANKNSKIQIIAGYLDGKVLNQSEAVALAKLPSLDELRGRLVGLLVAPATKIARLVKEPGAGIARVLSARSQS